MPDTSFADDATMLTRPANLVASEIDGEAVILNIDSGQFFQLNRIGSRVWDSLATPMALGELCRKMQEGFDVDPETCRGDVIAFVGQMAQHGLVTAEDPAGT